MRAERIDVFMIDARTKGAGTQSVAIKRVCAGPLNELRVETLAFESKHRDVSLQLLDCFGSPMYRSFICDGSQRERESH